MGAFETSAKRNGGGGQPGDLDAINAVNRAEIVQRAKFLAAGLKLFNRSYYESRTVEQNQADPALEFFRKEYHKLRTLIDKKGLSEVETGLTSQNIADFEFIANL